MSLRLLLVCSCGVLLFGLSAILFRPQTEAEHRDSSDPLPLAPTLRSSSPSDGNPPLEQSFEADGLEVTLEVRPLSGSKDWKVGEEAEVSFTIRDLVTGAPITGLHPLSWIHRRSTVIPPTKEELKEQISEFLGGLLSVRADIDLNRYFLLVLNSDNSISVIDPQIEFSKTKLYQLIQLQGSGEDWLMDRHGEWMAVSLPSLARVEFIDLTTFQKSGFVDVGEGNGPRDLALEPDGKTLWVGLDSSNAVVAIETNPRRVVARLPIGVGLHRLAISDDGESLCVTSSQSSRVTLIDLPSRTIRHAKEFGHQPYPVVWSQASRLFYVGHLDRAGIVAIDPQTGIQKAELQTEGGVFSLDVDPSGRFVFACDLEQSTVTIVDVSTHEIVGVVRGVRNPDQVEFTEGFAYVRNTGSPRIALIDLERLERGEILMSDLTVSRLSPSEVKGSTSIAPMIVPTPNQTSVMIASPADRLVYYYVEGMMASMGNFVTYNRIPQGLAILDRSLQESKPGVYSTYVRPVSPGRFDVPFVVDQPRILHGFELEILPNPDSSTAPVAAAVTIKSLFENVKIVVGETRKLRFQVIDSATEDPVSGLSDVQVMVIRGQGRGENFHHAKEVMPGVYEFEHFFPERNRYQILFRVLSRGAQFHQQPMFTLTVLRSDERSLWEDSKRLVPTPSKPQAPKGDR